MNRISILVSLLYLCLLLISCGDDTKLVDGDQNDGDISEADNNETDNDTTDTDGDPDEELSDGDLNEFEKEPLVCDGNCDENFQQFCMDNNNICICNEENKQQVLDCLQDAESCPFVSPACQFSLEDNMAICLNHDCPCISDDDCQQLDPPKDICVTEGNNKECRNKCEVSNCSETVGCLDIGKGNGCGVCLVTDETTLDTCTESGTSCGNENNGYCTDICGGLDTTYCFETCTAIANSCQTGETCIPYTSADEGKVTFGTCTTIEEVNCPSCNQTDGDADEEDADESEVETE